MSKKNKDIMSGLKQQMKDNSIRWKKINAIVDQLDKLDNVATTPPEGARSRLNTELLLLIIEQLRPASDYEGFHKGMEDLQKEMGGLVDQIMKTSGRK